MNLMGMPWTALTDMQSQRSHQIAWFIYGWIEREHFLNVTACADWWMRAVGLSAAQLKAPRAGYREHCYAGRAEGVGPRQ